MQLLKMKMNINPRVWRPDIPRQREPTIQIDLPHQCRDHRPGQRLPDEVRLFQAPPQYPLGGEPEALSDSEVLGAPYQIPADLRAPPVALAKRMFLRWHLKPSFDQ